MRNLCIFIAVSVCSSIGWWLGNHVGFGAALLLSSVGSLAGVYMGWRVFRDYVQ